LQHQRGDAGVEDVGGAAQRLRGHVQGAKLCFLPRDVGGKAEVGNAKFVAHALGNVGPRLLQEQIVDGHDDEFAPAPFRRGDVLEEALQPRPQQRRKIGAKGILFAHSEQGPGVAAVGVTKSLPDSDFPDHHHSPIYSLHPSAVSPEHTQTYT